MQISYDELVAFIKIATLKQQAKKKLPSVSCPRLSTSYLDKLLKEFEAKINDFFVPLELEHTLRARGCARHIIKTYTNVLQPDRVFYPALCVVNFPQKRLTFFKPYLNTEKFDEERLALKALKATKTKSFSIAVSTLFYAVTGNKLNDCGLSMYVTTTRFKPSIWRVFTLAHITPFSFDTFKYLVNLLKTEIEAG